MNWWKIILLAIGLVLAVYLGLAVISFLYGALWYLLVIGILALGGYVGYKALSQGKRKEIKGGDSVSQIELDNAKVIKSLEDYKEKMRR